MVALHELVAWLDERTQRTRYTDFPGSVNGLQVANNGTVTKLGAAVDAGLEPFRRAADEGMDLLLVHHGLFWSPLQPLTAHRYAKVKTLLDANLALYSCHLPLDAHPEIGNNALLAKAVCATAEGTFLPVEGVDVGLLTSWGEGRAALKERLGEIFPWGVTAIEHGSEEARRVAILTGSGASAIAHLAAAGADTLITGELKQNHYNEAQELGLNLYLCGHYATETFGVRALAMEAARKFSLPWDFLTFPCPL